MTLRNAVVAVFQIRIRHRIKSIYLFIFIRHTITTTTKSNSYMLLLSVNNFTWKRSEDMELFIAVYMTGGSTAEQRAPR